MIGVAIAVIVLTPLISGVVRELRYPLSDAAEIRQQARAEHLDPALVAAVIYAETKFDARTSPTGAISAAGPAGLSLLTVPAASSATKKGTAQPTGWSAGWPAGSGG